MYNGKSGKFTPKNKHKYLGDVNNIIYRSNYEKKFFFWCDKNESVIRWNSEEVIVPYKFSLDGKIHRYFVDNYVEMVNKKGELEKLLIEIKPLKYTQPPERKRGKKKQTYLNEVVQYQKNQDKWKFARQYADKNDMRFLILTEKELGIK